ncbi:MAG: hypothetical protein KJN63_03795 [Acidimicrobiia bacterium]|nr:hypothetical protein [Acidimicrobiia bacterium]
MYRVNESSPRLSQTGALSCLIAAACGLVVSAPDVRPGHRPDNPELFPIVVAWWVAAVLLVWLSISLGLWRVALGRPHLENSAFLRVLTVPGSRRLVQGVLTVGMITGCTSSASQLTPPRIEVLGPVDSAPSVTVDPAPAGVSISVAPVEPALGAGAPVSTDGGEPGEDVVGDPAGPGGSSLGPITLPEPNQPEADESSRDDRPTAAKHLVVPGDNLWVIAEARLSAHLGRPASNAEIVPFWIAVIDANLVSLRSGDPDLIHPGETIVLPPIR